MLFNITDRYRKNSFDRVAEKYVLYLKWGKNGKHSRFAAYDTKEEAIAGYEKLANNRSSMFGRELSEDYRIKLCKQIYSEECIEVPTLHELETKLPELKGVFC